MPHRIRDGLTDYLEVMQLAGVVELGPPVQVPEFMHDNGRDDSPKSPEPPVEPVSTQTEVVESNKHASQIVTKITERVEETVSPRKTSKSVSKSELLKIVAEEVSRCTLCEELALTRTQTVFGVGNPDSELVFLGEAPGADEDRLGEPFVGRAGKLLDDIIVKGMKLRREDVYICNILRCRPPGNRNPLPEEAEHCRPFLDRTLEIIGPKFICCLGAVAVRNLLQVDTPIGKMRGRILDYNGIKVICTYHPAYLLRNPAAKKDTWEDIKLLMREMGLRIE